MLKQSQLVFTLEEIVDALNTKYPTANIQVSDDTDIELNDDLQLVFTESLDTSEAVKTSQKTAEAEEKPRRTRRTKSEMKKAREAEEAKKAAEAKKEEPEPKPTSTTQEALDLVEDLQDEGDPFEETAPVANKDNTGSVPEDLAQIDAAIAEADSASLDEFD